MKTKGFTLIELMIVIAILGILAAIVIPNFLKFQCRSRFNDAGFDVSGEEANQLYKVCNTEAYHNDKNIFEKLRDGHARLEDILPNNEIIPYVLVGDTQEVERAVGTIRCYLPNGESYFSDNWIGEVKQNGNTFIFNSSYKEKEVKVSGPCVVKEE